MTHARFGRQTPAGSPLLATTLRSSRANSGDIEAALGRRLAAARVYLHRSGRAALRSLCTALSSRSGRDEVLVPAYTCYSVPSAVVAAGLRVRLLDVDERGWIAPGELESAPLERAAAIVVCNLFGVAEPIADVIKKAGETQTAVIDDGAQSLGARGQDGAVGARGDFGLLSFGRGKPLTAVGGGGIAIFGDSIPGIEQDPSRPRHLAAWARALAHDAALIPPVFRVLSAIPALEIGATHFDTDFETGPLPGELLPILSGTLGTFDADRRRRSEAAESMASSIERSTGFRARIAAPGEEGAYPRLALLARDSTLRDQAWARLRTAGLGPTGLYPRALSEVDELTPYLASAHPCPGGRDLARRILTVPTHERVAGRHAEEIVEILSEVDSG